MSFSKTFWPWTPLFMQHLAGNVSQNSSWERNLKGSEENTLPSDSYWGTSPPLAGPVSLPHFWGRQSTILTSLRTNFLPLLLTPMSTASVYLHGALQNIQISHRLSKRSFDLNKRLIEVHFLIYENRSISKIWKLRNLPRLSSKGREGRASWHCLKTVAGKNKPAGPVS